MLKCIHRAIKRVRSTVVRWRVPCAIALVALGPAAGAAIASSVSSSISYYGPVAGYNYENQAFLYNEGNSGSWGAVSVATQHGTSAPAGYMGYDVLVYTSSGSLCLAGTWQYNGTPAAGIAGPGPSGIQADCGAGNYFTQGQTEAWNGSAYQAYYTYDTPNLYI